MASIEIGHVFAQASLLTPFKLICTTSPIELLTEGRAAVDTDLVAMRHRSGSFKRVLDESNQIWDRSSIG
ncbi:hypothetical protein BL107_10012 [Synechococcus sp. BL107]|nr:hypothetical protein BL107_10012 [Synechococcus sp. BL107]